MVDFENGLNIESLRTLRDVFSADGELVSEIDETIALAEEVLESDGYRVQILHSDLHRSHYVVNENYEDLIEAITTFEEDRSVELDETNREEIESFLLEFARHFQNYAAAVKARVDHLYDTVINELEEIDDSDTSLREKYEAKMEELELTDIGYFFTGLRNHFMHCRPPVPKGNETISETWDGESGEHSRTVERQLQLRKEDILNGDHLNSTANDFLDSLDDEFHIRPLIEDFQERMEELFDWFDDEIESRFEEELDHTEQLQVNAVAKQKELYQKLGLLDEKS
jgi:hypothetical protein